MIRFLRPFSFALLLSLLIPQALWAAAGTVTVPLSPGAKRPAGDLVYRGARVDESQVNELSRGGVELWRLNPEESQLWKDTRLELTDEAIHHFPVDGGTVHFDSYLASTKGIFRASIDAVDGLKVRPFTMSVGLGASAALMRAALLRRVGYQVSNPKLYRALTLIFKDVASRDLFLNDMADRSLTSRDRWIKEQPKDLPQVTLQGVVLEPGRIQVQTVHWGLMSAGLQQDRRVFRALLVPDVLLDFLEKVNGFAWQSGRIFNGSAVFEYLYSEGFSDVAVDDIKWMMSRIAALSRDDLSQVVVQAGLPQDISTLLIEKVISRRNALVKMLGLERDYPILPFTTDINGGGIEHGQLVRDEYKGYPQEFYKKPELPPLRFSQLWRYAAIEGISAGLGQLLGQVNDHLLTLQSSSDAITRHQNEVSQGIASYLFKTGSLSGYQKTTGVWAKPIAGANLSANRTVVAGTYLGSDSQVQLVDTLAMAVNGGFYLGWDGAPTLTPGVANTVTLTRSYSHVMPVKDMNTALKANWGHLVVAGFMHKLSESLNPNIACTIAEGPWTSEFTVGDVTFTKINYDLKRPNGKEEALALRKKLISQGTNPERIILQANDRESDCKGEVEKAVNKNLEGFMDGLAVGDSFIITDSIGFAAAESVSIPITTILGSQMTITPNANQGLEIARQTMIRRVSNGFQIYLQDRRVDNETVGLDFNFFINILSGSTGFRHGKGDTDFYNIVTEGADSETKLKLIRSVKALLRTNSSEILVDSFSPYNLKHDILAKIARFKFLLWSKDWEKQNHQVDIYPPLDAQGNRNHGGYKRTLALRREVTRTGTDAFGFILGALGKITGGIIALPGVGGAGGDPGNSPGGNSLTNSISTQAEITDGRPFNPVTAVEQTYRGWLLSRNSLFKIFDGIEKTYGGIDGPQGPNSRAMFNREQFTNTTTVQLYQIDTTLMFYPEALAAIRGWLFHDFTERELFNHLIHLYGEKRNRFYCDTAEMQFGRNGPQIYRGLTVKGCAPDWVHGLMRMSRAPFPTDKLEQLAWYNQVFGQLMGNANVSTLLSAMNRQHYFFITRINGFRKNDMNGSVDYLSDTVGRYDNERGFGMYRDFASSYGIALYELYARFFTDGL